LTEIGPRRKIILIRSVPYSDDTESAVPLDTANVQTAADIFLEWHGVSTV